MLAFAAVAIAASSGSSSSRRTRTTTPTTRCCGAASCCTARCPSSRASACPTEHPLAIVVGALCSLFGRAGDRLLVAMIARLVPGAGRGASTGSGGSRSRRSSAGSRRCCCSRASTSRSSPRAATSTSRTWRSSCGRRCWRPSGRGAACRCSCCSALAGLLRPEAWVLAGAVLAVGGVAADLARSGSRYAALAAIGPVVWTASTDASSPATRCSRCTHTSGLGRGPRAPAHGLRELPAAVPDVLRQHRQAAGAAAARSPGSAGDLVRRRGGCGDAARAAGRGHRHVRADRRRRRVGDRALPARCAALALMVFAAVARRRAGRCSRRGAAARRAWMVASAAGRALGVVFTATQRERLALRLNELRFRGDAHHDARAACSTTPEVQNGAALRPADRRPTTSSSPTRAGSSTCPRNRVVARALGPGRRAQPSQRAWRSSSPSRFAIFKHAYRRTRTTRRDPAAAARLQADRCHERRSTRRMSAAPSARWAPRDRWPLAVAGVLALRSRCGSGASSQGLPYVYNADENAHFVPRRSGCSGTACNPQLLHQPAGLHVPAARGRSRSGSAAATAVGARVRGRPDARCSRSPASPPALLGDARASGCVDLAGARLVRPPRRAARRGAARRRVPAGPLRAPRAQRRADARAAGLALFGTAGVLRARPPARLRARGRRARPGVRDEVHGRDRAPAAAGGGRRPRSSTTRPRGARRRSGSRSSAPRRSPAS